MTEKEPADVIGEPPTANSDGIAKATLVTEPKLEEKISQLRGSTSIVPPGGEEHIKVFPTLTAPSETNTVELTIFEKVSASDDRIHAPLVAT